MGISITGGVKVPQGKFKVYVAPPPSPGKELWVWGLNSAAFPLLGDGTTIGKSSPVQVGTSEWASVSAGANHSLATKIDGSLWAWARGADGALGQITDIANRSSPVQIGTLTDWASVSAASSSSFAIKTDSSLWSWGRGNLGQTGQGDTINRSSPVQVGALTNWASVSGENHFLALKINGELWSWGVSSLGALGHNNITYHSSPVQVGALTDWASVNVGASHSVALKTDGTIWAWGEGDSGALGLGDVNHRSSPVQVGSLSDWASINAGLEFSVATKTDGSLWTWGYNVQGNIGDGTSGAATFKSSPVQIGALSDWTKVYSRRFHTNALKTDGSLWAWGEGGNGRIGDGTTIDRSSPVQIGSDISWTDVSVGRYHSHALKTP